MLVLAGIGIALDIITAIRVDGYKCDFTAWGVLCACITCWAISLEEKEKKEKENK